MSNPLSLECHVCCKSFSGPVPAQQHFASLEHKKKVDVMKQEGTGPRCNVCNISCDTLKILQQHNQSPRHLANEKKQLQFRHLKNLSPSSTQGYVEGNDHQNEAYEFSSVNNRGWCYVCSIELTSISHARSHINGKTHKKRSGHSGNLTMSPVNHISTKRSTWNDETSKIDHTAFQNSRNFQVSQPSDFLKCEACGVTFTGEVNAMQHYASDKHRKKSNQIQEGLGNEPNYSCSLCNVTFTGPENMKDHMFSQKHLKQKKLMEMKEKGEEWPLSCNACGCKFTGQENAEEHFKSNKHRQNLKNMQTKSSSSYGSGGYPERRVHYAPTGNIVPNDPTTKSVKTGMTITTKGLSEKSTTNQGDTSLRGNVQNDIHIGRYDERHTNGQAITSSNQSEFMIKVEQKEVVHGKQPDSLIVKPVETEDRSLIIKPDVVDSSDQSTENHQIDNEPLRVEFVDTDAEEQKIKAETCTSIKHTADLKSLNATELTSADTEPVRYFRNNLHSSSASMGRGRGIFAIFMQNEETLPGKVLNTGNFPKDDVLNKTSHNEDETTKKFAWAESSKDHLLQIPKHNNIQNIEHVKSEDTIKTHSTDKLSGNLISQNDVYNKDDMIRQKEMFYEAPCEIEEYFFDEVTGRGRCNICDIDFTSDKHKSQHISGKNHLKARDVHRQMLTAGACINSSLICEICVVTFSGIEAKEQHMASEKHKKKEMRVLNGEKNDYFCDICKVSCSGPENLIQHKMGAQHRKMTGFSATDGLDTLAPQFDRTQWFPCEVCRCSLNTYEQLKIHEMSPRHLKMLEKQSSNDLLSENGDRTKWYPCNVCNCRMNTYEQLQIHQKSPKHLKQVEKQRATSDLVTCSQTLPNWCNVCKCSLNSQEQLRLHEESPAHMSKLQKDLLQLNPVSFQKTVIQKSVFESVPSPEIASPLESFLSEELFPEEFLPKPDPSVHQSETRQLVSDFEEKLVMKDSLVYIPEQFAKSSSKQDDTEVADQSGGGNGKKHNVGSDIAWATRNRGTRQNESKLVTSSGSAVGEYDLQGARPKLSVKMDPRVNNPFAMTHPYYCHTCKVPMNTKESYENHCRGKRHMQKMCVEAAPQRTHRLPKTLPPEYLPVTETQPRNYQLELHSKAMKDDTLCFLPTGTGKTLVAVMTMSAMLEKYTTKNVLFLVDKVLLVLQQSRYIKQELGNKEYDRFNPDSETGSDIVRRSPRIAAVCMDQQATHGIPLWKHDIVVVTAAFCKNLLDKDILRWEDFSLVVFDEAHHCEKGHPFNSLLSTYHRRTAPENKPKILGLTASPAGKADVPRTLQMLQGLLANMGDVRMTIVEEHENVDTLNEYKSNAEMIIRPQADQYDLLDKSLKHELNVYIMHCLIKLYQISDIKSFVEFDRQLNVSMTNEEVMQTADDFVSYNFDMIQSSINMIESEKTDSASKVEFSVFRLHVLSVCMALSCLEECGALVALQEMEEMEATNNNFEFARGLGLPTANLKQILSRKGQVLGAQSSFDKKDSADFHVKRLIDALTDYQAAVHGQDVNRISLVLVKQRRTAFLIARVLQNSEQMKQLGLNTTCVVGHGGGGSEDKGMNVNQQKRVLDDIKQFKYQVIVATSVAEEGVDWPECERVISMYPPSTVTALVQMRGRARRKNSKFIVLCSSPEEEEKLYDIMQREENMIKATQILIEQNRCAD